MDNINIFGASGHAKVVLGILALNNFDKITLYDDAAPFLLLDKEVKQLPKEMINNDSFIIAIGNNNTRKRIANTVLKDRQFITIIHPKATIDTTVSIEKGTVIMASVIINASSQIGKHCIINTSAVVEHDCIIGDFVHISPSATLCGNVSVGTGTHIGAGAIIIPSVHIGKNVIIGAGAVVINDIPDNVTVVGNPAQIIKNHSNA